MKILAIDTSCDETAVAITEGRRIISNAIYSQIVIHKKWGGVVPNLAKRAHEEHIDLVIEEAVSKCKKRTSSFSLKDIDAFAVTYGPGLGMALGVGINKARELSLKYQKPFVGVNHMAGHIYSSFVQNSAGNPKREISFPYLALLISGGHTELVIFKDHDEFEVIGETLDDAAGEALDKAAKMMGLGYPGGAVIEKLAKKGRVDFHTFPRPMKRSGDLNFSFSGLKTSLFYYYRELPEKEKTNQLYDLAASYQEAVFDTVIFKLDKAMYKTRITSLVVGGGVGVNEYLRGKIRALVKKHDGTVYFPARKYLYGDNAAMIGVAAYFKAKKNLYIKNPQELEREPRLRLSE